MNSVKRKPYLHFLVNVSKNQNRNSTDFRKRLEQVITANKPLAENSKISFVNSYVSTSTIDKDWKEEYLNQTFEGGFYLDRAIKTTLFNTY